MSHASLCPTGSRKCTVQFMAHFITLLIIFVVPEVVMTIAMPQRRGIGLMPGFYLKSAVYIAVFYINYLWLVNRTILTSGRRPRILSFVLSNLGIIVCALLLCYTVIHVFGLYPKKFPHPREEHTHAENIARVAGFLMRDLVMMVLTISLAVAMRMSARWHDLEARHQKMLAEQRSTELAGLKSQLNPHFLFNTLNTIYALVDISPEDAKGAVHRLSGLLRYVLYEDVSNVELRREVEFLESYVELMRLRMGRRPIHTDIDVASAMDASVPPLLFIPLIENAFKYGNRAPLDRPISISMRVEDGKIVCRTENSFVPKEAAENDEKSSGIGLPNLRRRLTIIYDGEASLRTSIQSDIYTATLSIPVL